MDRRFVNTFERTEKGGLRWTITINPRPKDDEEREGKPEDGEPSK